MKTCKNKVSFTRTLECSRLHNKIYLFSFYLHENFVDLVICWGSEKMRSIDYYLKKVTLVIQQTLYVFFCYLFTPWGRSLAYQYTYKNILLYLYILLIRHFLCLIFSSLQNLESYLVWISLFYWKDESYLELKKTHIKIWISIHTYCRYIYISNKDNQNTVFYAF